MISNNLKEGLLAYAPALLSGVLLIFCFSTFDFFLLAWVALIPLLISLYGKTPKQAFRAGVVFGLPYFFGTLYWIYHSINHYGGVSLISSVLIVILLCLFLSLYPGIFAFLFSLAIRKTKLPALLIAPAFWVVLEFLRSYIFTGFPWSSIGYSQYKFLPVIQVADITGIYGISFLVVAVNGAFADIFIVRKRIKDMPLFPFSYTVIGSGILFLLVVATFFYGQARLKEDRPGDELRVSIIQGNIEQDKKWEPAYQNTVMETYRDLSLKAAASSPALIVWPETAVPFIFNTDMDFTEELIDFQSQLGTHLFFGSILVRDKVDNRFILSNSAVLLDDTGKISYTYDKIHLVPFGEYVPLQKILFFINRLVVGIGDYKGGKSHERALYPFGEFAPLICYEIIFPGLVRKFYADGGDFMINITNDAWFGKTAGPYQHFNMAVFRAVENRKPLVRAANTGISGLIDSSGRILSQTALFERTTLTRDIKTDRSRSFYSRYGDLFSYIWIVVSILLLANIFGKPRNV
jgi:apolipoprotein N-acyltransferase